MPQLVFDSCCFCVDLRVGCFIIGYLNAVGSALGIIMAILGIAAGAALTWSSNPDHWEMGNVLLAMSIVTFLAIVALCVFSVVLLVGLHKKRPRYVMAYLICSLVYVVISLILFIVNMVLGPITWDLVVTRILGILFNIYILLVIRSYYYKMQEEPSRVTYTSS